MQGMPWSSPVENSVLAHPALRNLANDGFHRRVIDYLPALSSSDSP